VPIRRSILRALIHSLRFDNPDTQQLSALDDADWHSLLSFTDRTHMTLTLARHRDVLPEWVRERIDHNIAGNAERARRIQTAYLEIAAAFEQRGIDWAVLKGFSHDIAMRHQSDIDLLCTPEAAATAQDAVVALGYEPLTVKDEFPADHMPLLIRRTGWRWRGDFYDPEQPPGIEIHFRLWDPSTECIHVEGVDEFWERRRIKSAHGLCFPAFDPLDSLAYAALHVLRHLLRGDLLLWHIYELAFMLHRLADDAAFWSEWNARYNDSMRLLLAIPFELARRWFGCRAPGREAAFPEPIERWFALYAQEPAGEPLISAKSEVWLHVSLLSSRVDAMRVIRRKLIPAQKHRALFHPNVLKSEESWQLKLERRRRHAAFLAGRALYHVRTLAPAVANGLLWSLRSRGLNSGFLQFLGAAALYNFGMTVFFLLYNLHLLKRGFHEDFLGAVTTATTVGSIAGTIPAGLITSRFGLKPALLFSFLAAPLICVLRAIAVNPGLLITSAFLGGFAMSLYAVSLAPVVAQLAPEKSRPLAFSLVCSSGIGIGIFGSSIGGALPEWVGGLQSALIAASAIAAFSAIATLHLPLRAPQIRARNLYPRDPAVTRYLAALALWSLATGTLNPFFNVYFSTQLKAPLSAIGVIFSASQLTQVLAVLAAPLVLRRLGMPTGIMAMQIVAGISLGLLAIAPPLAGAAVLYASYMAFQYMSEPGMFSFLMDHAKEEERGGAAALNILVLFAGQAIAASVSGVALHRFGYPPVLIVASLAAIIAGFCFRLALSRETPVLLERSVAR
jgi:predicted MFS family arabinose efflux permease